MKYIILNDNKLDGYSNGLQYITTIPILSGELKGKFACSEICKDVFKEIFEKETLTILDVPSTAFDYDTSEVSNIQLQIKYTFENKEYIIETDKEKLTEEELKKLVAEDSATKKEVIKDLDETNPIKK